MKVSKANFGGAASIFRNERYSSAISDKRYDFGLKLSTTAGMLIGVVVL
jgi:tetrahydromethanopterin S-methyltransferase subunit F